MATSPTSGASATTRSSSCSDGRRRARRKATPSRRAAAADVAGRLAAGHARSGARPSRRTRCRPATRDVFRNFVVPVPRDGDALRARASSSAPTTERCSTTPTSRSIRRASSRALDRLDPQPGFAAMPDDDVQNVFGWSPGKVPVLEPADTAWALEEGSDLVVQLHMVASVDGGDALQPAIGLFFSDDAADARADRRQARVEDDRHPRRRGELHRRGQLRAAGGRRPRQRLPARSLPRHARCAARRRCRTAPSSRCSGSAQWDVRWQDQYRYRTPVSCRAGRRCRCASPTTTRRRTRTAGASPPAPRHLGTAVDRRDGRAVAGGDPARAGGRAPC